LLSLAIGCVTLAELSVRCTDQPQSWARIAAISFGVAGAAMLILRPSTHVIGLLGWVWPLLLIVLVAWMFRELVDHSVTGLGVRSSIPPSLCSRLWPWAAIFETVTEAATSNDPPSGGRTDLVAGHSLYLRCSGSGSPAVILFNGLGERTPSLAWVERDVAAQTRVCVFDRAGEGWSGKGVGRQDAHELSADVKGLLAAAHVPGPYVLAGHSVGGVYALAYAMDHPEDVAGVALIDSATPYQFDLPTYPAFYSMWRRVSALLPTAARAGLSRVTTGMIGSSSLPADARSQARAFASSPRELNADRDEFAELRTVLREVQSLKSLNGKPLFVVTGGVGEQSGWSAAQKRLATLSTNSVHQTAHGATHAALIEDRKYAAISGQAINAVVRAVRTSEPVSA
jgi:pimeloyl-ACP methyl ester carboxylesterase